MSISRWGDESEIMTGVNYNSGQSQIPLLTQVSMVQFIHHPQAIDSFSQPELAGPLWS